MSELAAIPVIFDLQISCGLLAWFIMEYHVGIVGHPTSEAAFALGGPASLTQTQINPIQAVASPEALAPLLEAFASIPGPSFATRLILCMSNLD